MCFTAFIRAPYISTIARNTEFVRLQKQLSKLWPSGVVGYYVDNQSYDSIVNSSIQTAIKLIESDSCVKFKEESRKPNGNKPWIHIANPNKARECVHEPIFKQNGEILLSLGYDCLKFRDILHTILHGIGLKDEVSHPHRDKYVRVIWNNILPRYRHLFIKEQLDSVRSSFEYDPLSIMHFHDRAYSVNGKPTIIPLEPGLLIHPSEGLSQLDKMRLNLYFGHECNRRKVNHLLNSCKMTLRDQNNKLNPNIESNNNTLQKVNKTDINKEIDIDEKDVDDDKTSSSKYEDKKKTNLTESVNESYEKMDNNVSDDINEEEINVNNEKKDKN